MCKYLLSSLLVVTAAAGAYAETLTPEQALSRVAIDKSAPASIRSLSSATPSLIATKQADNKPTVYVFSGTGNGAGYLVVSADDVAPALLGYSDDGQLTADNINPELEYWLNEYSKQIEYARNNGAPSIITRKAAPSRAAIDPMVKTRWNQDSPYNDKTPTISGTHCVTGCVATALAQVMKYHNWPAKGTGSNTYTPTAVGTSVTVDFGNTTYDWANMLDTYDNSATQTQKNAVATLMLSAGVAVNMQYTRSESAASSYAAAVAMSKYFGYDKGIINYQRDYYGIEEWNELVYNQLKNYGPVQYSGSNSTNAGHSFVCDGYSEDGYFHINWGWGGMSDGYFLLTALDPESQGIGGSTSGYNLHQDIIGNVKPATGTSSSAVYFIADSFAPTVTSASLGNRVTFNGPFYSYSTETTSGSLGVKLTASDGTVTYITASNFSSLQPLYGYSTMSVTFPRTLANGTYTIEPVVRTTGGEWTDIPVAIGAEKVTTATIANNTITFANPEVASLELTDITTPTPFYIGSNFRVQGTLTNTGTAEYLGTVTAVLVTTDGKYTQVASGLSYPVDITAGESTDLDYISTFYAVSGTTLTAGKYYLCFADGNGNQISQFIPITLNAKTTTSITVSGLSLEGGTNRADKHNLVFHANVRCTSGYFAGTLRIVIFPYTSGTVTSLAIYESDPIFVSSGQTATMTAKGDFSAGSSDMQYFAMVYNGSSSASNERLVFTVAKDTDAVGSIEEDTSDIVASRYYNLNGIAVDDSNLAPGIYIVHNTHSDGSVTIEKIIRQ